MKCEIELSWRNNDEDLHLSRTKRPEEVWATPGSSRNIHQMIAVLDQTYQDARAALISMLPPQEHDSVDVAFYMNKEMAQRLIQGDK